MLSPHPFKKAASALLLASLASGVAAWAKPQQMTTYEMVRLLAAGAHYLFATHQANNQFIRNAAGSVVITNTTDRDWKFGYLKQASSELNNKQSGTIQFKTVNSALDAWNEGGALLPDAAAVTIPPNHGSIVLTPVVDKTGLVTWEAFFRVCYLQDQAGNRVFLNITKETAASAVPTVGIAQVSYPALMKAQAAKTPIIEMFNKIRFYDKEDASTNMLGICAPRLPVAPN